MMRPLTAQTPDYLKVESNTILFLSKASAGNDGVIVIHGHDTLCTLKPGTYLRLVLPSKFAVANLFLTGNGCTGRELNLPLRLFSTDLYLLRVKKNREIVIGGAYEQVKTDILNGMNDKNTLV